MKNQMVGKVTLQVFFDTDFNVEEFLVKFKEENIVTGKVKFVISDGTEHVMDVCDVEYGIIESYIIDGEETVDDQIYLEKQSVKKQKVTKPDNLATKITDKMIATTLPEIVAKLII